MFNTSVMLLVTASLTNKPSQGILAFNLNIEIIRPIPPNVCAKTNLLGTNSINASFVFLIFFFFFMFRRVISEAMNKRMENKAAQRCKFGKHK